MNSNTNNIIVCDERDKIIIDSFDNRMLDIVKSLDYFIYKTNYRYMYGIDENDENPKDIIRKSDHKIYVQDCYYDAGAHEQGLDAFSHPECGLSLQQLAAKFEEVYGAYNFGGLIRNQKLEDGDTSDKEDQYYLPRPDQLVFVAFEAIKELANKVDQLEAELANK